MVESIRRLAHDCADLIADYLEALPAGPVFVPVPPDRVTAFATQPVPVTGRAVESIVEEFRGTVAPYPFGNGHPRFFAWVNSPPHPLGIMAEALAATMNPSVAGGNHAAVHLEHQVVRWFLELAGWPSNAHANAHARADGGRPEDATGLLVSGGSQATLTALAVARHRAARLSGVDIRADGMSGLHLALYVGEDTHSCVRKAAELLGLGSAAIRVVGSDDDGRLRVDELRDRLRSDRRDGVTPMAVVATVGTANTGAVDPVGAIADLCAETGTWLHVDGAYGGPAALLLDEHACDGLERADSLALDPHKWLYASVDAGLVLLRSAALARECFSLVPPYLRTDGDQGGVMGPVWFSEFGLEQTRPFRALKVWMLLNHLGLDGYRARLRHDIAMARRLAAAVRAAPDLELLAGDLSIVCFRARPDGVVDLDRHNAAVATAVQLGGRAFLAQTTVRGVTALRACVVNPGTRPADVDALIAEVRATSTSLQGRDPP